MDLLSRIDWEAWQKVVESNGITIDRPKDSVHPHHRDIVYPINYGYVNETMSADGEEVDIFVGSSDNGIVGAIATTDFRKGDSELKLIYNCTQSEIYLINGFINFDREMMEGTLILRIPFASL